MGEKKIRGEPVERKPRKNAFLIVVIISLLLIAILLTVKHVFHPVVVIGTSMEPTFHSGEFLTTKTDFTREDIHYNTVIAFETDGGKTLIKRVIGLPGDTIEVRKEGTYRNNRFVKEDYGTTTKTSSPVTLREDEYFVMGDNRNHSEDSREIGPIKFESITNIVNKEN